MADNNILEVVLRYFKLSQKDCVSFEFFLVNTELCVCFYGILFLSNTYKGFSWLNYRYSSRSSFAFSYGSPYYDIQKVKVNFKNFSFTFNLI